MKKHFLLPALCLLFSVSESLAQINIGGISIGKKKNNSNTNASNDNANKTPSSTASQNSNTVPVVFNFIVNPNAPADYNANLNVGDLAIAVDSHLGYKEVRILEKVTGGYKVVIKDASDWEIRNKNGMIQAYANNSVYPYYDVNAFKMATNLYMEYVKHYVECFSKKHNISMNVLKGYLAEWPKYFLADQKEINVHVAQLEELNKAVAAFNFNFPNTYLMFENNPFLIQDIATNRADYIKCLVSASGAGMLEKTLNFLLSEINNAKATVDAFDGSNKFYDGSLDWVWRAVSAKERKAFFDMRKDFKDFETFATTSGQDPKMPYNKINTALDALNSSVATKLPGLKMDDWLFKYHDAAAEAKMKAFLKTPATLKVYKIGISDATWLIETNNLGIPKYKYKRGQMFVRNSADDHPYCKGLFFVIQQDYAGGGTYGESRIVTYHEELYGCPR